MGFVTYLPWTPRRHDAVWVIVDRLTKSAHFLVVRMTFTLEEFYRLYIREIVRLHGVSVFIVSDRDPEFMAHFWKCFPKGHGGTVTYWLALPLSLSSVHEVFHDSMLQKYTPDPAHVVDWGEITVDTDGTLEEGHVCIMDIRDQVLRRKTVLLVKVLWQHRGVEEATWESENTMRATYTFLFEDEGVWSNIWY